MKRLALIPLLFLACSPPPPLEVLGSVPEFALTDQKGAAFAGTSLNAKVWVANFIFTNCTGPCPRMTGQMRRVQKAVREFDDVRLVSFTVDPERDSPAALADYAQLHKADTAQWSFLTGPRQTLNSLAFDAFHLNRVDGQMEHSTRFALVDRRGRIRAYYDTTEPSAIEDVIRDIKRLRKET